MKAAHEVIDIVRLGLHSLSVHKVRSFLTSLGIVIGVWAVMVMLAILEGSSYEAQRSLREMGSDNIIIESIKPPSGESKATSVGRGVLHYGLTRKNVEALRDNIPGMLRCVTVHRTLKYAYVGGRNLLVAVIATEPTYADVARIDMTSGRFISSTDLLLAKPHCVITESLARRLFACKDPVGRTISLAGEPFIVVGILPRLPLSMAGQAGNVGNYVIVPLTADRRRFGEFTVMRTQGGDTWEKVEVSQVILQMHDDKAVIDGATVARSMLGRSHREPDYDVIVPLQLLEQLAKQRRLWTLVFFFIASVSLLVGGIGIMNIMLASVTERTREIGIRRAMGAKRRDIIVQFLVESVTLTTAGGLIGIALGLPTPFVTGKLLSLPMIILPVMLILPFTMAVVVGLVSGLYPAMRAAKLDPTVALRHE